MLHQIWVFANTLSDLLIASAMLYHVSLFRYDSHTVSLEADRSTLIPQLRRVWIRDGYLSNHVLVSVVRLTVETNLVTSKNLRGFYVMMRLPSSHAR